MLSNLSDFARLSCAVAYFLVAFGACKGEAFDHVDAGEGVDAYVRSVDEADAWIAPDSQSPPDAVSNDARSCLPLVGCSEARSIGSISGDEGNPSITTSGLGSEWLVLRVTEDDGSVLSSVDLSARFTLSAESANYDLVVYRASDDNAANIECIVMADASVGGSLVEDVTISWTDERPVGGEEDSRNITVEIRNVSGGCEPGQEWTLVVDGHVN